MKTGEPGSVRLPALNLKALILIGCLGLVAGFVALRGGGGEARNDFQVSSETRIQAVQREIENDFSVLAALRTYFDTPNDRGPEDFDRFANKTVSAHRTLRSLKWAPRVRDPDRRDFEARLRERSSASSGIVAGMPGAKLTRAPNRPDYFPIEYVGPWDRAAPVAGYDLLSNPALSAAIQHAIASGEPSSTGKLNPWDQSGEGYGVTTVTAVYDTSDRGRNAAWRAAHCRGVIVSVIQTADLLASALRSFGEEGIRTYVFDLSSPGPRQLLYPHGSPDASGGEQAYSPESLLQEKLVYAQRIFAGGRDWQIVCVGTRFATAGSSWRFLIFLLFAVGAAAATAFYLWTISRYTRGLASTNAELMSQFQDHQKAQDELAYQAFHDALTGLPNRRQFGQRFNEAIEHAKTANETLALFYVDLDGFKIINDTLGHAVGDGVLKAVAERFRKSVGKRDVVARTGGDEFNILLVDAGPGNLPDRIAQGLLESLSKPIEVGERVLSLSASIGISIFPTHGQDFQELAHCADAAMYFAKKRGKNRFHRYSKELAVSTKRGMELALSLRGAIERNELCLFFQPILGLGMEANLRFEALLRWRHPQIGLLGPGHFLSIAEETGLTAPIGKWVLHEACRLAQSWQSLGHRPVGVAVNTSSLQFSHPEFMESLESALAETRLNPSLLEIEMTESAVVNEIEESIVRLGVMRRKGISVAIDDFGTGYSSLTYLEALPIDALKIDRSFLPRSESNFRRSSLLRSLIALGRSLNLRVIVGGIEVARQFELVRGMGPNEVQGFLFSKPLAAPTVPEFIQKWNQRQGSQDVERILDSIRMPADLVLVSSRMQAG